MEASKDYKYLLSRGYSQKISLDTICSRYMLSKLERNLLLRCIHRPDYVAKVNIKKVSVEEIRQKTLVVDLLNTLSTLATAISGGCVYLCDDGLIRDLGGSKKVSIDNLYVAKAIDLVIKIFRELDVLEVIYVIDKNVSFSLDLVKYVVNKSREMGLLSSYLLAEKADRSIIDLSRNSIVVTTDFVIIDKVEKIFDLVNYVINKGFIDKGSFKLIDLSAINFR
ncbi:MAG: DUF434 domain-containing protein [Sulfolobales archaeon]